MKPTTASRPTNWRALLDGLLEQPESKAVVFGQWTRTHDIVIRRLEARGIGYVGIHGGVPSEKRPAGNVVAASGAEPMEATIAEAMENTGMEARKADDAALAQANADPWGALLQFGSQLAGALAATDNGGSTPPPWIERDAATGNRSLKSPLPQPEAAKKIADVLAVLADALRGR